jgi:site-specific DNA-methyltransferase (adenine-specific)
LKASYYDRNNAVAYDAGEQAGLFGAPPTTPPVDITAESDLSPELGQWMTPTWAAAELVQRHFSDLSERDFVLEPSCGRGAFLTAIPEHVRAIGVEIDPALADIARRASGRRVETADFRTAPLPAGITAIIGNPPFPMEIVQAFLERAHAILPKDGRVGFILPCSIFQTASTVVGLSKQWGMQQEMIPRNLFQRLQLPLCFATLTKGHGKSLVGFALYQEAHEVNGLGKRYRAILAAGERSVWAAVVRAALEILGGEATVQRVYAEIQGNRPTENRFWQAKVRQTLQRIAEPCGDAHWRLAA